jgi:hypothetical protein
MRQGGRKRRRFVALFLLAPFCLVHCLGAAFPASAQAPKGKPSDAKSGSPKKKQQAPALEVRYGSEGLPGPVLEMREAILAAVKAGRIEELLHAFQLNELKPDLGVQPMPDPVAHWKAISGDGEGREILAALAQVLDAGYVALPLGRDLENNRVYVWPYFAEVPLAGLTPPQEVELLRLVPPSAAREMKAAGKYTSWRLSIGADGTWHSFRKQP